MEINSITLLLVAIVISSFGVLQISHAQEFESYSINDDIANDPVAQDILEKIEKTKRWIENIEKRAENKKEIQEKRDQVIANLQEDLEFMEEKYKHLTFEYRLEQMRNQTTIEYATTNWHNNTAAVGEYEKLLKSGVSEQEAIETAIKITTQIHGIFLDNLSYTHSKIKDGQKAFDLVIDNGGTPRQAQAAYASAAQIKYSDMIAINALSNVNNNMAYYNQQILFEQDGQFNDLVSGDFLRLYYQDYRLNPAYIIANPDDPSWKTMGKTDADTECRIDHVLVYRDQTEDYVCTTDSTAELWQKNNMGTVVQIAANPYDLSIEQLQQDRINKKIENANKRIQTVISSHIYKLNDLDEKYEEIYAELQEEKETEKLDVSDPDVLAQIEDRYDLKWDVMMQDKKQYVKVIEDSQIESQDEILNLYKDDRDVKIVWNAKGDVLQAVKKID